jgi:hypothetical protein
MDNFAKDTVEVLAKEIAELITRKQYKALQSLNYATVDLYWRIGMVIAVQQEEQGWGKSVVQELSEKLAPLVREISWSGNIVIMEKCKGDREREFYLRMTKRYGWTKRLLSNYIENGAYEQFLLN